MGKIDDIRLPPKWIELNLTKRECAVFISSEDDEMVCQCGRNKSEHVNAFQRHHNMESWTPSLHTNASPTDTYGTMVFEGGHYPNKAKYVRLSYDTKPELIVELMTLVWGVHLPKLLITIRGGNSNFELPQWIAQILQTGLVKAAKTTNAWIITNGLNKGVSKHVGNAVQKEHGMGFKKGRVVTLGISPWGITENRHSLIGRNKEKTYNLLEHTNTHNILLNPRHSHFLLVDNGSLGKFGGESIFRRRLEKYISMLPTSPNRGCDTPVVCVIIEGGFYTLRNITDYLYDEPPVPVVVFNGTGRTADLISGIVIELDKGRKLEILKPYIYEKMKLIYKLEDDDAESQCDIFYKEIERICGKRDLLTIYNPRSDEEGFDGKLLGSIFRSSQWTALQQLSLTLVWDRVDIARKEVFTYGKDWSRENLEHAMMEALVTDRLQFINLLIEHGLNMQKFLTPKRLENLYSVDRGGHTKVMRGILYELLKAHGESQKYSSPSHYLTLHDIGLSLNKMMGHIFKSKYINHKYVKHLYEHRHQKDEENEDDDSDEEPEDDQAFLQPFSDLFVWAILTKRHSMALLIWPHGPGALAKSLIAVKLNRFIGQELEPIDTNVSAEYNNYAVEWETLSYELLDTSFKSDPKMARQLLTMELDEWSKQTCLTLGVMANHRMFLGHPCCQTLLADLWMGALNFKNHAELKVVLGIVFPFLIFLWDFKSVQELKLLPYQEEQQQGEHEGFDEEHHAGSTTSVRSEELTLGIFRRSQPSITSSVFSRVDEKADSPENKQEPAANQKNHDENPVAEFYGNESLLIREESKMLRQRQAHQQHHHHHRHVIFDHHDHHPSSHDTVTSSCSSVSLHNTPDKKSFRVEGEDTSSEVSSVNSNVPSVEMLHEGHHPKYSTTSVAESQKQERHQAHKLYQEIISAEETGKAPPDYHRQLLHHRRSNSPHSTYGEHHHPRRYGFMDFHHKKKHELTSSFETTKKELTCWKKFIEFQQAPITNFYRHAIAYIAFVCCLSYVILIPQDRLIPGIVEIYVIAYLATLGCDIVREIILIDAYNWSLKFSELRDKVWTVGDLSLVLFFMVGVGLRMSVTDENDILMFRYGMLIYRISSVYWNLRLYKYMTVHRFLGPKLVMMSKMLRHMAYFALIIFVVLLSFGLAREAIRFPDIHPSWHNIETAFLEPYVMMFGEVDSDSLLLCGEEGQVPCPIGHWVIPLIWIVYMMVANILIVNVLIAVFNGIYSEVDAIALEVWLFQRFTFVMEFERKPLLPPPFIIICHLCYLVRWMAEKCYKCFCGEEIQEKELQDEQKQVIVGNDHSLKSYLTPGEMNQVYDFELDNVDTMYSSSKEENETSNVLRKAGIVGIGTSLHMTGINEHQGLGQERFSIESAKGLIALRAQVRELTSEIDGQRIKLEKLIGILESKHEHNHGRNDLPLSPRNSNSKTSPSHTSKKR